MTDVAATNRLLVIERKAADGTTAAEVANLLTLDGSNYLNMADSLVRRTGGRWRSGGFSAYRHGTDSYVTVEVTATEAAQIAASAMNRAVYARVRTTQRWAAANPEVAVPGGLYGMPPTMDLPICAKVSTRGRTRYGSAKPTPTGTLPGPILRPNGVEYYPRTLFGVLDVEHVRRVHKAGRSTLLYGPPGTGKTAMLEAAFSESGFEYVPGTSDTEAGDFVGQYAPLPGGSYEWIDGPLLRAMVQGKPLIIDEIALIDPRALSIVYAATDGRRECYVTANAKRGTVKAADGFGVHAACNPDAPGADMSEALLSRMFSQIEYGTDYELMAHFVPAAILTFAMNLEKRRIEGEVTWSPQARELFAYVEMKKLFDEQTALANLVSSAPALDRHVVTDILQRAVGAVVEPLRIGGYRNV